MLATEHFRFHLTEGTEKASRALAEEAEERYLYLCSMLQACDVVTKPIDVYLAADPQSFSAAFPEGSRMGEWAVGVAFIRHGRIVLRAHGSALFSLRETFDHEVSHILVHGLVGEGDLPRWLSEGLAIWQAGESVVQRLASAQRATLSDSLMPLSELNDRFPAAGGGVSLAYAEAALFVRWLEFHYGHRSLILLLHQLSRGTTLERAFHLTFHASLADLEARWAAGLRRQKQGAMLTLLTDPNLMWIALSLLFIWVSLIQRRRRREQFQLMGELEGAQQERMLLDEGGEAEAAPEAPAETHQGPTYH